jgi:3-phenylpropionate/trans-cinnamate dioxygenase ferredoxin reductase subunit
MAGIIVIGAGQAGSSLVVKLRALGCAGPVTLIGGEPVPPYQRPPLSKKYMLGGMDVERLFLRPAAFYADQNITLRLGVRVTAIDRDAKTVTLDTGEVLDYDQLALTTGSDPIQLPPSIGGDLDGVYTVRTLKDADAMAPDFVEGKRALIVGGGYIGLEAAAVAATRGVNVVLVEMAERILQRVAAPETSDYFRTLHTARGVDIREGVGLASLNGEGHVTSATLTDGTELEIDFAVVGVGIRPSIALADGLTIDNGIKVDGHGRTSDPSIFAAGDCTSFPHKGGRIRLESVPNAIEQAEATAAAMLGGDAEYHAKPWFWSDQYDVKLQIAGLNTGYDRVISRKTDSATSFWYYLGDQLLAVDAMNDPRAYMVGKRLIEAGKSPDPAAVQDPATDLKTLL